MCYELSRRNIILAAVGGAASAVGLPGLVKGGTLNIVSDLFERRLAFHELTAQTPLDKADKKISYLKGTDMSEWHTEAHPFLRQLARRGFVPQEGRIVELGSYKGQSLKVLNEIFGADRVQGMDVYAYSSNPQIQIGDIRQTCPRGSGSVALVWNDVSNWENSPRSKMAAFQWARSNLVKGGIYVDDAMENLPVDLDLKGFELIFSRGYITAFRKT